MTQLLHARDTLADAGDLRSLRPRDAAHDRVLPLHLDSALSTALPAYAIGEMIGRGTFGVVYAARHRKLGRRVAIKQLWPDLMSNEDARRRFATEARLLASLDHPNIVRIHDYIDDGVCALILELTTHGTLKDQLERGPIAPRTACSIAAKALAGLEHAHERAVVHRDVKPENLLFSGEGVVKLADFGLAKALSATAAPTATFARLAGTPAFMAPEQIDHTLGPISPATDVWAVGAILYQLLAGRRPSANCDHVASILLQRITSSPPPLRHVVRQIPVALSDVVARAMSRTPARRFESAGRFAEALEEACGESGWG